MIPCSGSEIHRWNALDDLDDDISDRVHEDLIPFDDSNEEYGDPDLVVMDSFTSSEHENSTVDESEEGRYERKCHNNSSSEFSHSIDEDGLILALDDSTNRRNKRQDLIRKSRNNSDVVLVRVKKSVKYGSNQENAAPKQQRSIRMKASNQTEILRPVPSTSRDIMQSYINEIQSDGTMNSMSPTYGDEENTHSNNNNIVTVRVKKSVKYGAKAARAKEIIRRSRGNSCDILDRPTINTIHSDGTISSQSPTGEEHNFGSSIVPANSQLVQAEPRVATIYSDGTIGYSQNNENDRAMVENPVQKIATIHSDGTISYRSDGIGSNETNIAKPQPSTVATIHSDGFITYSSSAEEADANNSPTYQTTLGKKSVSFDNAIVTDTEDNEKVGGEDDDDDEEDMDDDICDNIDDSRYTRSLHSMPVLEEVTEEESPLHYDTAIVGTKNVSSTTTPKAEPSWLELKKSPSATTTMTPRRSNDEDDDEFGGTPQTSDQLTSRWLGIKGLSSSKTTKKSNVTKYQSMDGSAPRSFAAGKKRSPKGSFSRKNVMLRVETCSTGSQSVGNDDNESLQDLEAGGSPGQRQSALCCRTSTSDKRPLLHNNSRHSCCCRRRDWIAALIFVLIGIAVGVGSYFIMHRVFVDEKGDDLQQERIEDWTMVEESPFGNKEDSSSSSPDGASTTSNDFDPVESDTAEQDPPSGVSLIPSTEAPKSSTISTSNDFDSKETEEAENDSSGSTSIFPDEIDTVDEPATFEAPSEAPSNAPVDVDAFATSSPTHSPTHSPTIAKIIPVPVNGGMTTIIQDSAAINEVIRRARREIELLIFADDDLIGKFLRLVFHDCIGGCDGCVDMTNPKNNGLDKPMDVLQPIADRFEAEGLSRTDLWMLAALVASELALPFLQSDLLFPLHWIGRQTCETKYVTDPNTGNCGVGFGGIPTSCSAKRGPHIAQPHGSLGTASMLEFFETEFGFDAQQVTAIMGAHSVGKMARENVGFMGIWDLTTSVLDGGYWQELVGAPPDYFVERIDNSDLPNIPDRHQWRGIIPDLEMETVVMLNVDVALVRNIGDMDENGNVGCAGPGILLKDCPNDTPFLQFAQQYNADNRKFILDFRDVLSIMIDHGNTKPTRDTECPEGRICVFDNTATNFGSLGFALEQVSPPPTSSPTTSPTNSPTRAPPKAFPQAAPGQPQVSLDLVCYEKVGDILVVSYDHVAGTDITFEVYRAEDVDIFQGRTTINPRVANAPLKSTLSCAKPSCHTFASKGGLQISTADLVGGGSDYVVLLLARGNHAEPNADLELLAGDSFRLEGCND